MKTKMTMLGNDKFHVICSGVAMLLYMNTLNHQFTYDDRPAILENQFIIGASPVSGLLQSDFWGVPLSHSGSHKSYRPLTSLSFRINWWLTGPSPFYFHATNIFLHGLVTFIFMRLASSLVPTLVSRTAGILFAVHPIHCEAVSGIVGRADILSAVFYLLTLLVHKSQGWSLLTPLLATAAMLAKEQGVTVLGACFLLDILDKREFKEKKKSLLRLMFSLIMIISIRAAFLGGQLPTFSKADNPASHSSSLVTRTLTFLYLPVFNAMLLLCPSTLSYDWSMESVPLVTSLSDIRNSLSVIFYSLLVGLISKVLFKLYRLFARISSKTGWKSQESSNLSKTWPTQLAANTTSQIEAISVIALALSLIILPFLPATNLFFYVGFVVAERLLYLPSLGYCLLLAYGFNRVAQHHPSFSRLCLAVLVISSALKTITRNGDWENEETLFKSGLIVNPAKSYSNLGNILYGKGNAKAAEAVFKEAIRHRSNMADTHYNLGILLQNSGRLSEAALSYQSAIKFRPKLAVAYLNLGVTYSDLGRKDEAIKILQQGSQLDDNGLKDPKANANARISAMFHLGKLLLEAGEVKRAISVLLNAVKQGGQENILNLLGESYQALGQVDEAEQWYSKSLQANPTHIPAHLTLAKMLAKNESRDQEAESWFQRAKTVAPAEPTVYVHYGLYLMDRNRFSEAAKNLGEAARLNPSNYDNVFNAAVAYREAGQLDIAELFYRRTVEIRPMEAASHMNLGALLHLRGKLAEAEEEYIQAWTLRPGDQATRINIQRLHNIMKSRNLTTQELNL